MSEGLESLQKAAGQFVDVHSKRDIRFVLELAEQLHHWGDLETSLQLTELALSDSLPTPVFLMGFLRSGTTLTKQILAAHPDVVSSDENDLIYQDDWSVPLLAGFRFFGAGLTIEDC